MTATDELMVVENIPLVDIFCDNDFNCRGAIPPIDVVDLAKSIQDNGLQQPIVVQPWNKNGFAYRIVSGHRRFTAYKIIPRQSIPAIVKTGLDDLTARKLNFEENLKRKNLNILQEARALTPFMNAGWTEERMGQQFGQSRGWVQSRVSLLKLPNDIQLEAAAGFINQDQIKQLATMDYKAQVEAVKDIKTRKLNGEKGTIRVKARKVDVHAKRPRQRDEIFKFMDILLDLDGPGMHSRCLAWCAGEISDLELYKSFKEYLEKKGIKWKVPVELLGA